MERWERQLQSLQTEAGKIRIRIQYLRHVTARISAPDVIAELDDHVELCLALSSLNQHIAAYEKRLDDICEETVAYQEEYDAFLSTPACTETAAIVPDPTDDAEPFVRYVRDLRQEVSEVAMNATAILVCFTEEAI